MIVSTPPSTLGCGEKPQAGTLPSRESAREGAIAAPQFEDRSGRAVDESRDPGEGRTVGEEVLAEFVTAAMG